MDKTRWVTDNLCKHKITRDTVEEIQKVSQSYTQATHLTTTFYLCDECGKWHLSTKAHREFGQVPTSPNSQSAK